MPQPDYRKLTAEELRILQLFKPKEAARKMIAREVLLDMQESVCPGITPERLANLEQRGLLQSEQPSDMLSLTPHGGTMLYATENKL